MLVFRQQEELKDTILILLIKATFGSYVVDHIFIPFSLGPFSCQPVELSKQGC